MVDRLVDGLPGIDTDEAEAALHTLDQDVMPEVLIRLAEALRAKPRSELGDNEREDDGIQGVLVDRLAGTLQDVDVPARRWLRDKAVLSGIDKPIEPGGVFPLTTVCAAEVDLDSWYQTSNDAFFDQHKAGVEAILQRELQDGWLTCAATEHELERARGSTTCSPTWAAGPKEG